MIFYGILVVCILLVLCYKYYTNTRTYTVSSTDSKKYITVSGDQQFTQESANVFANINSRILLLIEYLSKNDANNNIVQRLKYKYNNITDFIQEAIIDSDNTTYTIDKQEIHVCIRSRDAEKKIYDINLLMYVIIHELAHICNDTVGHDTNFINIFKYLLTKAIECNVYTYENYRQAPKEYCGITINSQVL